MQFYHKSPIGNLEVVYVNEELISLKIVKTIGISDPETDFTKNIKTQLNEYFQGKRQNFNIKLNLQGSEFQKKVWEELKKIPYGTTKSYCQIAKAIGNENAQRAVGSACNKNPVLIIIPCHRVIPKNGNIGGFAYGYQMKRRLLQIENNKF